MKSDYLHIDLRHCSVLAYLASPVRHSTTLVNESVFNKRTSASITKDLYSLIWTQRVIFKVKFYITFIRKFYFKG